jgi:hypothetical protein
VNPEKLSRRFLVGGGLLAALSATDAMAQATAQAFVENLYRPYLNKSFQGQPYSDTARFFVPALAQAMDRDNREAKRRKEVPTLDGDPFVDAQDWEISKLSIDVTANGDAATARVSFHNFGEAKRIMLQLAKTPAGWRIAEIKAPSGSLKALYKLK